jgi:glycosyltransferase involved in cell wall biosynthesis
LQPPVKKNALIAARYTYSKTAKARVVPRQLTVVQIIPALNPGGVERSAIEIAEGLVLAGHRAIIIAKAGRWSAWAKRVGAELIELDVGQKSLLSLRHVFSLRRLLGQIKPDIVHTRSRLPSWLTFFTLKLMGASAPRWVTTVHGLHSVSRYSAIQHAAERVIAVSHCTLDYLQTHYPKANLSRVSVIPRGVNPAQYRRAKALPEFRQSLDAQYPQIRGRKILLLPGRGTRLKGHAVALSLLATLAPEYDVCVFFAGIMEETRSPYLQEMHTLASKLGVADRVVFSPARADLTQMYQHSALVLQLSTRPESFGRTVAEALLCGTPVLGFDLGGVGEQLRLAFPTGLSPPGDAAALAARAAFLLGAESVAIDTSGICTLQHMQQTTLALYCDVLGKSRD